MAGYRPPDGNAPRVRIRYCGPCGYRGRAEALARIIQDRSGYAVTLERGNFGVFKVWLGERLLFDKRSTRGWLGKLGFGKIPPDEVILERILATASQDGILDRVTN